MFHFKVINPTTEQVYEADFQTVQEGQDWHSRNIELHGNGSLIYEDRLIEEVQTNLWSSCNDYCQIRIDNNDRSRYNAWLVLGNASQKQKVQDNIAWVDSVWTEYYRRKDNIIQDYDFSSFGNPPWSFRQIAESI